MSGSNGLTAALQTLLSNSSVTEQSLNQMAMLNEWGYRCAAGTLQQAANGQIHVHDLSIDVLTIGGFGNTTIVGWANVESTLEVGGDALFHGNVAVNGSLTGDGTHLTLGSGTANSTTFLAGDHTYKEVASASVPLANTTVNGTISTAAQSFAGVKTFTENVAVSKALSVSGNAAITGNLAVTGLLTQTGNVEFSGYINVASTLQVASTSLLNGALTVNAAATINGAVTIKSTLSANGGTGSAGQFLTSGAAANSYWSTPPDANTTVNGYITTAAQSFAGVKTFTENVAVSKALTVSGNTAITGNLTQTGNATFSGFANVATTLQVTSTALLNGALTVNAAASVNGAFTVKSTVSANGSVGTAGDVLTSGGAGANSYWTTAPGSTIANTTANGLVSTTTQSFAGVKTFTANLVIDSARLVLSPNTTQSPYFMNFAANNSLVGGANSMWFAVDANATFSVANNTGTLLFQIGRTGLATFTATISANGAVGTAGNVLTSGGAGANAYWASAGAGSTDIANTTANGLMSFVDQSFAGVKTFTENVAVSKAIAVTGNLAVTGLSTLTGNVTMSGYANVGTTLQVTSTTLMNGALTVNAAATVNGAITGKTVVGAVATLVDGATPALDSSLGDVFVLVAAGNRTIAVPTNAVSGHKIVIRHTASGADRTLALNSGAGGFRFGADITALTATTSGKSDYIGCIYNSTDSFWDVVAVAKGY